MLTLTALGVRCRKLMRLLFVQSLNPVVAMVSAAITRLSLWVMPVAIGRFLSGTRWIGVV